MNAGDSRAEARAGSLRLGSAEWMRPVVRVYPVLAAAALRSTIQRLVTPARYLAAVRGLDHTAPRPQAHAQRTLHTPATPAA